MRPRGRAAARQVCSAAPRAPSAPSPPPPPPPTPSLWGRSEGRKDKITQPPLDAPAPPARHLPTRRRPTGRDRILHGPSARSRRKWGRARGKPPRTSKVVSARPPQRASAVNEDVAAGAGDAGGRDLFCSSPLTRPRPPPIRLRPTHSIFSFSAQPSHTPARHAKRSRRQPRPPPSTPHPHPPRPFPTSKKGPPLLRPLPPLTQARARGIAGPKAPLVGERASLAALKPAQVPRGPVLAFEPRAQEDSVTPRSAPSTRDAARAVVWLALARRNDTFHKPPPACSQRPGRVAPR